MRLLGLQCIAILVAGTSLITNLRGQDAVTARLFGEGVHRYFSGDCQGALTVLADAIAAGSEDPRVYLYHGLAQECLGGDGSDDFAKAAQLEATGRLAVNVNQALERIQGPVRLEIEKLRREAKLQALLARKKAEEARRAKAAELAKKAASLPQPQPIENDPTDPAVAGLRANNVVVEEEQPQPAVAEISPGPATTGAAVAPAGGSEQAGSPPTAGDPFGGGQPVGGDPFNAPGGSSSDPFGGTGSTPADPFGGSGNNADPFGSDPFGSGN